MTEVKSSSHPTGKEGALLPVMKANGAPYSEFDDFVRDVTFQALNLEEVVSEIVMEMGRPLPSFRYELLLVHPDFVSSAPLLRQNFDATMSQVNYVGAEELVIPDNLFVRVDLTDAVRAMMDEVRAEREHFRTIIETNQRAPLSARCKNCTYRTIIEGGVPNGFLGCWKEHALDHPHVLDVPNVHLLKLTPNDDVDVVTRGITLATDVPVAALKPGNNNMQQRVIRSYETNSEVIEPELTSILASHKAPYAFIDFEAHTGTLSYWPGNRASDAIAFQWSCHTVDPSGVLAHAEWLWEQEGHPAAQFLTSLYNEVKDAGTIYIWSPYEIRAVRCALEKIGGDVRSDVSSEVREWAKMFAAGEDQRVVDLCELAKNTYAHPRSRGSFSIKRVLDAIWTTNHRDFRDEFSKYYRRDDGDLIMPYRTLPVNYGSGLLATIRNGGEAVIAYHDMVYGRGRTKPDVHEALREALLAYCELDTAAMVIIWKHWKQAFA
jgi:hypothetical protein